MTWRDGGDDDVDDVRSLSHSLVRSLARSLALTRSFARSIPLTKVLLDLPFTLDISRGGRERERGKRKREGGREREREP